jgi:hypothetical protein
MPTQVWEIDITRANRTIEALQTQAIPLALARICVDCEIIHSQQTCPRCGSELSTLPLPWGGRPHA